MPAPTNTSDETALDIGSALPYSLTLDVNGVPGTIYETSGIPAVGPCSQHTH